MPAMLSYGSPSVGTGMSKYSADSLNDARVSDSTLLWTAAAGLGEYRLALTLVLLSVVGLVVTVPYAGLPLAQIPGFIPAHEAALVATDLVTALLLFGQFSQVRAASLLALACGYLFDAMIVVPHALSYPGVFFPGGLPGAGGQTTAWLYMLWHGGFPLFVIAYVALRNRETRLPAHDNAVSIPAAVMATAAAILFTIGLTWLAMKGDPILPAIMDGHVVKTKSIAWIVWAISLVALVYLWRKPARSTLDLWLMVVMVAWLLDITLSAIFISARFELGFYAGRAYGLIAATFVLAMMIIDTSRLHARLAEATGQIAAHARELDLRVRERTAELSQINQQLEAILEAAPVAIYMVDTDGIVTLWTASAERVFGFSAAEALGRMPPYILDDDVHDFRTRLSRGATGLSSVFAGEIKGRQQDGTLIDVAQRGARVNDKTGRLLGIIYIAADITGARKVEEQLRQSQKMEAIGNLTGGMAHDFNNLLGIVIGNLDLLKDLRSDDEDVQEFATEALQAALRGADLTKRLLAFARRQPLRPERATVNDLVSNITTLLKRTIREDVEIILELGDDIWPIVIDPVQLESSLANLANNARDAMPGGGKLIISTSNRQLDEDYATLHAEVHPGDYALIEVSDTGTGMPPEVASRIFEPFFTTKEEGKGTGLGLAMVFGFMKQSGGHLNVYSEVGIGTTFRLYLPRAGADADAAAGTAKPALIRGHGECVLAVEDNPGLRRVVVRQLDELGYHVVEAENPLAAMGILESQKVDLLLTDVVMPGGTNGYELARTVQVRWPTIRVVLTSGFPERINTDRELSNVRLLSKPYRRDDLARVLGEVLAETVP
jgi:PAS domain S-box-containing protein